MGDGAYTAGNYRLGTASTSHSKVHMVLRTPTIYFDSDAVVVILVDSEHMHIRIVYVRRCIHTDRQTDGQLDEHVWI